MRGPVPALCIALIAALAACGGGGGSTSGGPALPRVAPTSAATSAPVAGGGALIPIPTVAERTATVIAVGTADAGARAPNLTSRVPLSLRQLKSVSSVKVDGVITPSNVTGPDIIASQILTPSNGSVSISLTFSNVAVGNNAILIVRLSAIAPDASTYDLGVLCALVNVTSSGASVTSTLSLASTQRCMVASWLHQSGLFTAADWQDAGLDARLAGYIKNAGITPDPAFSIYSYEALTSLTKTVAASLQRTLTVTTSPALPNGRLVFLPDTSDTAAAVTALNVPRRLVYAGIYYYYYSGAGTASNLTLQGLVPYASSTNAINAFSCFYPEQQVGGTAAPPIRPVYCYDTETLDANGTLSARTVYGGSMRVTALSTAPPSSNPAGSPYYSGGAASIAPIAAGTGVTATIPVASTERTITFKDAEAAAFGPSAFHDYHLQDVPASPNPLYAASSYTSSYGTFDPGALTVSAVAAPNVTLKVQGLDPDPTGTLGICAGSYGYGVETCSSLASIGTFVVNRPYADFGTNYGYFNYAVGGGTLFSGATPCSTCSYTFTFSGKPGDSGTLTTTTPTMLVGQPRGTNVYINTSSSPSLLVSVSVTGTDATGAAQSYTSTSVTGSGIVSFPFLAGSLTVTQLTFTFTIPATASAVTSGTLYFSSAYQHY